MAALGQIIHGTTLVTNALIERKGAPTALLASEGFRDSLEIGREHRYDLYDLQLEMPRPLVPRYLRFGVPGRTLADGSTLPGHDLDEEYVERLARELAAAGIEAVAIAFLNSFANPELERRAREAVQRAAPDIRVSISSDVVPEIREYERTSTTVANVYVQARVERYLRDLEERLARAGFRGALLLLLSSGALATVETAARFPVRLLESGPAGGALAAAAFGAAAGYEDLLSFDMGGTTAKFAVIDHGEPLLAHGFEVDRRYRFKKGSGLPIKLPVIEMIEIGAGGGSIARIDALGLLKVGPDSAGADPGPACYGRGGERPTVTDADLVLGYLDPGFFLGGAMSLDVEAAREAIRRDVAEPLGLSVEEAAWGIHQIVNEVMAGAARVHTLERGGDPRRLPVFAFGGAGPVHGYRIAAALGSPRLIVPSGAGVMSAIGFLAAPLAFDFARSFPGRLDALDWARVNGLSDRDGGRGHRPAGLGRCCAVATSPTAAPPRCATSGRGTRCACRCRRDRSPRPASPRCARRSRPNTSASTAGSARRCRWKRSPGASSRPVRDPICVSRPRPEATGDADVGAQRRAPGLRARAGRDDRRCRSTTATGWDRARPSPAPPSSRSANRPPSSAPARRCRSMSRQSRRGDASTVQLSSEIRERDAARLAWTRDTCGRGSDDD